MQESTHFLETADIATASEDYASRFSGEVGAYFLQLQLDLLLELLPELAPGTSVLDVGGGHAQLAVPLAERGCKVTVTGSNESCRRRLAQQLPNGAYSYQTCDMLHLPFADRSFDFVIAFRLVPHVDRWPQLLAELARVAGKAVVIDYPDLRSINILNSLFFHLKKKLEGNTRTFGLFNRAQIISEFTKNGMVNSQLRPEFLLPMVLHRKLRSVKISGFLENCCRSCGLTQLFGSPIILRVDKAERQ
ncbi:MAG: Methyltransferase domain-containing protein [Candidatus Electronema aureum]|uniref:Methyltransferase domain-containing protein n=1 Tax=Candidatus Electronema aureum TaxID=2005002 RepID=A0A521G3R7_9BACT|nr:MAG: Methyltransferase domain-containing protein [Candidatus Electronema aureum]